MTWAFSFVSAEAKAELDALPADVRASFERIVRLVQTVGLERVREPYIKHIEDRNLGNAVARQGWNRSRALCDGERPVGRDPAHVRQEDPEDAAP
jgi:hypothetical protein